MLSKTSHIILFSILIAGCKTSQKNAIDSDGTEPSLKETQVSRSVIAKFKRKSETASSESERLSVAMEMAKGKLIEHYAPLQPSIDIFGSEIFQDEESSTRGVVTVYFIPTTSRQFPHWDVGHWYLRIEYTKDLNSTPRITRYWFTNWTAK